MNIKKHPAGQNQLASGGAAAGALVIDFAPPFIETIPGAVQGDAMAGGAASNAAALDPVRSPGCGDARQSSAGTAALSVAAKRPYARPGDRWIEVEALIGAEDPGRCRLEAAVYPLGQADAVAWASAAPRRARGRVRIDLRALNLKQARLGLALLRGNATLGVSEIFLEARGPDAPIQPGAKVKILLDAPEGAGQLETWPVTFGVPFAAGTLWETGGLRLVDGQGREIPSQVEPSGLWAPQGAVKWARFDALVTPGDGCYLEIGPAARALPETPLTLAEKDGEIVIDTGAAVCILARGPSPIKSIYRAGTRVADLGNTRGLYLVDQDGRTAGAAAEEEDMIIEARGPVAACVRFEGWYKTEAGVNLGRHITRVECFAGQPFAKITHSLVLTEDSNKVWFKEVGWELAAAPGAAPEAWFGISPENHDEKIAVRLDSASPSAGMLQDSHFHLGHGSNHFSVAAQAGQGRVLAEGAECGDWAALVGKGAGLQIVCRDAARQHPKEFEVFPDRLTLKLFSSRGGEELDFRAEASARRWDLANWFKKMPYKDKSSVEDVSGYKLSAAGWAKTHHLLINVLPAEEAGAAAGRAALLLRHPLYAQADPWWIYKSGAMGPLYPRDPARFPDAEKAQEDVLQWWLDTDKKWGENGFVDYFAGPHLLYYSDAAFPVRYCYVTYNLRTDIWRIMARSGRRAVREFCEGTTRAYMDNIHMHWDPPPGSELVRGLFRTWGQYAPLPFYWGDRSMFDLLGSSDLHNYMWHYYLTGERRARDVLEQYARGAKQAWAPEKVRTWERVMMITRLLAQSYEFTLDPDLMALADANTDLFRDRAGALLLGNRQGGGATYKIASNLRGLIDAWNISGDPDYRELALRAAEYVWRLELGGYAAGYNPAMAVVGNFLYDQTGEDRYAQAMALTLRQLTAVALQAPGRFSAEKTSFVFAIDLALDTLARSGADTNALCAWMGFYDVDGSASIVVRKAPETAAELYYNVPADWYHFAGSRPVEASVSIRPLNMALRPDRLYSRIALLSAEGALGGNGVVRIPKDIATTDFELGLPRGMQSGGGKPAYVIAGGKLPLVLHAPGFWSPASFQVPAARYYFNLPAGSRDAQILFTTPAKLYDPSGALFGTNGVQGEINLPADRPGLWSFEVCSDPSASRPVAKVPIVHVRNIPPFFAAGDPGSYFEPDIPWERQTLPRPPPPVPPETIYVPGAIGTPGNQAVYLAGARHLKIEAGAKHPSGDGSLFLPHKTGTIEFFMKPSWNSAALTNSLQKPFCYARGADGKAVGWLAYSPWEQKPLSAWMAVLADGSPKTVRPWRSALFEPGKWVHIAWVWGETMAVYVDGQLWDMPTPRLPGPPASAMQELLVGRNHLPRSIEAGVDELRISDVARYTAEFDPPDRNRELPLDRHTRLLMHFNGNLDAQSYGQTGPVPARLAPPATGGQ